MYVTFQEDPLGRQIQQFQEFLATLSDPWFFLRKEGVNPTRVISDNAAGVTERQNRLGINPNRRIYPVQHWEWGGSQVTSSPVSYTHLTLPTICRV